MKFSKKIFSAALAGVLVVSAAAIAFEYNSDHWSEKYIDDLSNRNIMSRKLFSDPDEPLSREDAAKMVSVYMGDPEEAPPSQAISSLMAKGIVDGYPDGSFRPEKKMTRAEFASMAYRIMKSMDRLDDSATAFADSSGHWAEEALESLAGNFILKADVGAFRPDDDITRSEATAIISRMENGGDFYTLEEAFRDDVDAVPTLHQRMKEAIIKTNKIPVEKIGSVGSWPYPTSLEKAGLKITDEGVTVAYKNEEHGISELEIPYSRLLNVLNPEFVEGLGDSELKDKMELRNCTKKKVALTFDDGPRAGSTPRILDALKAHGAKATFYVLGTAVLDHPKIASRIVEEGHEIASHSWSHPAFSELSDSQIHQEILSTEMAIYQTTGEFSYNFRPPYINIDEKSAKATGMPVIIWSTDSADYASKDPDAILEAVKKKTEDGDILIFHDIHHFTADSMDSVLTYLESEGYEVVTVSELYGYDMQPGVEYISRDMTDDHNAFNNLKKRVKRKIELLLED